LVRSDPLTQGPRLFAQHCASCHAHVDPSVKGAEQIFAKGSAANLFEFGGESWVRGLLDPKQVASAAYFGNTAHSEGDMVSFVSEDFTDKDVWKQADKEAVVFALVEEAGLLNGTESTKLVKRGRELIADTDRCGSCHPYRENETELGYAPDLNGWGSTEWVVGIISDPTHQRFYPDTNDRMPRFGVASEGGLPALTSEQIELISRWLRGSWYRPAVNEQSGAATGHP
jgi:ubiquinol-cytochrome c reductase cytochrome b subunit